MMNCATHLPWYHIVQVGHEALNSVTGREGNRQSLSSGSEEVQVRLSGPGQRVCLKCIERSKWCLCARNQCQYMQFGCCVSSSFLEPMKRVLAPPVSKTCQLICSPASGAATWVNGPARIVLASITSRIAAGIATALVAFFSVVPSTCLPGLRHASEVPRFQSSVLLPLPPAARSVGSSRPPCTRHSSS
jgi:hypothetical protein